MNPCGILSAGGDFLGGASRHAQAEQADLVAGGFSINRVEAVEFLEQPAALSSTKYMSSLRLAAAALAMAAPWSVTVTPDSDAAIFGAAMAPATSASLPARCRALAATDRAFGAGDQNAIAPGWILAPTAILATPAASVITLMADAPEATRYLMAGP